MFPSVAEDQNIWQSVFEISVATVYKGLLILLSPLWQMPPWHRMSYATVILSGIISLCTRTVSTPRKIFHHKKYTNLYTSDQISYIYGYINPCILSYTNSG